jgi:hypothetical protein
VTVDVGGSMGVGMCSEPGGLAAGTVADARA